MLNPPVNDKIEGLFKAFCVFQVLFKANLIFKVFQDSPVNSSTFQACANPVIPHVPQEQPRSLKPNQFLILSLCLTLFMKTWYESAQWFMRYLALKLNYDIFSYAVTLKIGSRSQKS